MPQSRRSVLTQSLALGVAGPGAAAAPDWTSIRRRFLIRRDMIYMNAANIAPTTDDVLREYQRQISDFQSNPSFQNREQYKTLAESIRARLAKYTHAQPDEVAITRNTSESNNTIAQGVRLNAGDEVLITAHNHPSNTASWMLRAKQAAASVVVAPVPIQAKTPSEIVDSLAARVTPRTRVIAVSHFTNTTGLLYPVREIAQLAHSHKAWFHVDGAQTFGWLNLDLGALGADSYSGSMHKWPMGPLESGILFVRKDRVEELTPAILSVDYWSDAPQGARKFETVGQRDDPKLRAMEKAMDFLELLGAPTIEARAREIARKLRAGLASVPGVELRGSGEPEVSGPVVKVNLPGRNLTDAYNRLWGRNRIAIAKTDSGDAMGLRFSPHIYNFPAEIDEVLTALKSL